MKREHLLWLLAITAGAAPVMQFGQGDDFDGLRFGVDGTFNITIFEDLHFGEPEGVSQYGPSGDNKTTKIISSILDNAPPSFAVLNGDLLSCEYITPDRVNATIDQLLEPFKTRNVPWGSTYGPHDMTSTCSTRAMAAYEQKTGGQLAWTQDMVQGEYEETGTSNYYVPIYGSTRGGNPNLVMLLWFFDSRGGKAFGKTSADGIDVQLEDWVGQKVVDWFNLEKMAMAQQFKRVIPSVAFVHTPVYAMKNSTQRIDPNTSPGINEEAVVYQGMACESGSKTCHGNERAASSFMQALGSTQGLMAVFSGHSHGNDWCMSWTVDDNVGGENDIPLCFGRWTGYGGYGTWARGARQIVLRENTKEIDTWITLEDGNISGHVMLNATFGTDEYSAVDVTKSPPLPPHT
ncbi:Metallo-dependent phosphatase [Pleomassaria siparia CBS 279.74]|uniref:Metallo-dependent phosphatase n=1 Tax=Pleomassaria siparia CBS 279.74 TaxID=1314801 RepID=A0A6G1KLJ0_9PLEO|nr:Metallo-dependent phosphatase [Pleomassaria siparia CBS 279.74]